MKHWTHLLMKTGMSLEKENMIWNMTGSFFYAFASMVLSFLVLRIAGEEQGGQTYRKYCQVDRRVMESGQQKGGHHQPDELTGGIERLHTGSPPSARRECRRSPEPVPGRGWTG